MRHNLEAFAGTTRMRILFLWDGLLQEWLVGSRCEKDPTENEFKQRTVESRDRRKKDQALTVWMEPLDPADLKPTLCWTSQLSLFEMGFYYHIHTSSAQHRVWHRAGTL